MTENKKWNADDTDASQTQIKTDFLLKLKNV